MKINFSKIKLMGINGKELQGVSTPTGIIAFHKHIGEVIYASAKTIALWEIAKEIYNGEEVELTQVQADELRAMADKLGSPFMERTFVEFINTAK